MFTVFIAGSISIKRLAAVFMERIDNIAASGMGIVVGDADGADASIQSYLFQQGISGVTVYCSGDAPRNNIGDWPVHTVVSKHRAGTRAFFTAKDIEMAQMADYGLMMWDSKSTGTLSNVIELLGRSKKSVVFINKERRFQNVGDLPQLEELISFMAEKDRQKADEKISLSEKMDAMRHDQAVFAF